MKDRLPPLSSEDDTPQRRIYPEPPIISAEQARPQVIHLYHLLRHATHAIEKLMPAGKIAEFLPGDRFIHIGKSPGMRMLALPSERFSDPLAYFMMTFSDHSGTSLPDTLLGPHLSINLPLIADEKIRSTVERWVQDNPEEPLITRTHYELNRRGDVRKMILLPRVLAAKLLPPSQKREYRGVTAPLPVPFRTIDPTYIGAAAIEMLEALGVPKEIYSQRLEEAEGEQES